MGLGKTIQTVAFVAELRAKHSGLPTLVCVPLSTLANWQREFDNWAPHLNAVSYYGSAAARQVCLRSEFFYGDDGSGVGRGGRRGTQKLLKAHVVITSYEIALAEQGVLKQVAWEALVVDEGHRLKSKESKLFAALQGFSTRFRLLLPGTPLQNNLEELWTLLHFLQPEEFDNLEAFQSNFESLEAEEQIGRLHKMLAPHILRRLKSDVLRDLIPNKKELMVRVDLAVAQKSLYQLILTRNYEELRQKTKSKASLTNVLMELKKCANHPWLVDTDAAAAALGGGGGEGEGEGEGAAAPAQSALEQLVSSCGKMELLDRMLEQLRAGGHRVLIFSQMVKMLDILEDY